MTEIITLPMCVCFLISKWGFFPTCLRLIYPHNWYDHPTNVGVFSHLKMRFFPTYLRLIYPHNWYDHPRMWVFHYLKLRFSSHFFKVNLLQSWNDYSISVSTFSHLKLRFTHLSQDYLSSIWLLKPMWHVFFFEG